MANTKVTTGVIKDDAVGADQLASNAVVTASIVDNAITTAKINNDAILTAKISNSAVTNAKLSANSVDSDQYVDGSIDTAHIGDAQITSAKLDTNIAVGGTLTVGSHLNMGDGDILKMGASADLQIYHDGSNSYVSDEGAGNLIVRGGLIALQNAGSSQNLAQFTDGGAAQLYYAGAEKLATTSSGVTVTGNVTAVNGIFTEGNSGAAATSGSANNLVLENNSNAGLTIATPANGIASIFYSDPSSNAAGYVQYNHNTDLHTIHSTGDIYLDSTGVGIGTSSPTAKLDVRMSGSNGDYGRGRAGNLNLENTNTSVTEGGWLSISGYMGNSSSGGQYQMGYISGGKQTTAADGDYGGYLSFWTTSGGANGEANSGGYERVRIDSSGKVGIGQTSPTDKLHIGTNSGGTQLKIQSASSSNNCILHTNGTTDSWRTGMNLTLTNGSYEFYDDVNNVSRMVIDSSGNLLVAGTSAGTNGKLQVTGDIGLTGSCTIRQSTNSDTGDTLRFLGTQFVAGALNSQSYLYSGGGQIASVSASANALLLDVGGYSGSGHRLKVQNDSGGVNGTLTYTGNVGIGTDNPSSTLHVDASLNGTLVTIHNTNGASGDSRGLDVETSTTGTTVQRWLNAGSELGRFTATGYLLVGTTSLTIGGSSGAGNEGVVLGGSLGNAIAVSNGGCLDLNRKTTNGTILEFRYNGSSVGSISTNANSLPSDRNFKKHIEDLHIGLDLVTKLKPVSYNYKIDNEDIPKMYGLIAQDLEQSLEEVGVDKNSVQLLQHKPNDNEKESDYSLDYLKLTPILVKAIQEQQTQIETLKAEIQELKG
jgi:hypothetical protein